MKKLEHQSKTQKQPEASHQVNSKKLRQFGTGWSGLTKYRLAECWLMSSEQFLNYIGGITIPIEIAKCLCNGIKEI
jgi:hypothetical protein